MPGRSAVLPRPVRLLIDVLLDPTRGRGYALEDWDLVVRVARKARVLGTVGARFEASGLIATLPAPVREHLASDERIARHRQQLVTVELERVGHAAPATMQPIVLLKGAAYVAQGLPGAARRDFADVDIMVPWQHIDEMERALLIGGWESETDDEYDQHYYREWGHELPPLRFPGHAMELDLHHNLVPPTGRLHPRTEAFFADAQPVSGTRFAVLCPEDQVLHASIHLCQDSDFDGRLREVIDIDWLIGCFEQRAGFWGRLIDRATLHGITRPLWYALRLRARILGRELDGTTEKAIRGWAPCPPIGLLMDALAVPLLLPRHPDAPLASGFQPRLWLLTARYFWLRFPPLLLARHVLTRARRAKRPKPLDTATPPE